MQNSVSRILAGTSDVRGPELTFAIFPLRSEGRKRQERRHNDDGNENVNDSTIAPLTDGEKGRHSLLCQTFTCTSLLDYASDGKAIYAHFPDHSSTFHGKL